MALPNSEKVTSQLATLPDQALKQMAMMHKADPYMLPLIISEDGRRKQMRQAAQAQMAQMAQPKVADADVAEMGIAQLPAPNMQHMADGGIAGYDDGGMTEGGGPASQLQFNNEPVVRMASGGMPSYKDFGGVNSNFEDAFRTTLRYEGGYVENDAGKGPSKFGINKTANPDVDIKKLTKDQARDIYKKRYWDAIGGDSLAEKDPALAKIAFDTAVNMGPARAKKLVEQSKGDPSAMLQLRQQHYDKLIEADPKKFAPYKAGWESRIADLATSVVPSAQAGELPKKESEPSTPSSNNSANVGLIGASSGLGALMSQAPMYLDKFAPSLINDSQGLSQALKASRVAGGVMGAVPIIGAGLSSGTANALSKATPEQLAQMEGYGADPSGTSLGAAILNPENRAPENAPKMPYGEQMLNVAKLAVGHPDITRQREANIKKEAEKIKAEKPFVKADSGVYDREDMEEGAAKFEAPKAAEAVAIGKAAAPEGAKQGLTNDDYLTMGLSLLANKSRNLMTAIGEAGLNTVANKRAREKSEMEKEYMQAHGESFRAGAAKARAEADYLGSGVKGMGAVQKMANENYDNWLKAMEANPMLKMQLTPELAAQKQKEFLQKAYQAYKMDVPADMASSTSAPSSDPLGILSKKG